MIFFFSNNEFLLKKGGNGLQFCCLILKEIERLTRWSLGFDFGSVLISFIFCPKCSIFLS